MARIYPCRPWAEASALPERLDVLAAELDGFVSDPDLDLAVLELHGARLLRTPGEAGSLLHSILSGLRERDTRNSEPLTTGIEEREWDFRYGEESFFLTLFAPLYPRDHSRWSGEADIAFLLLQPERGFRNFGVSSRRPARRRLSERVHDRFRTHGRNYDLSLNTDAPKALRYVKPVGAGDPPIRWWEHPADATPPT